MKTLIFRLISIRTFDFWFDNEISKIPLKASMPLPSCFNATRDVPGTEMPRVTGKMRRSNAIQMMLFDLDTDPYEYHSVTEENPEIVNLLLGKLADYYVSQNFQIFINTNSNLIETLFLNQLKYLRMSK